MIIPYSKSPRFRLRIPSIESVPVVRKFLEVFPNDFPGIPPEREIDFCIDLIPDTNHISIPPYRMTPVELNELMGSNKKFTRQRLH